MNRFNEQYPHILSIATTTGIRSMDAIHIITYESIKANFANKQ